MNSDGSRLYCALFSCSGQELALIALVHAEYIKVAQQMQHGVRVGQREPAYFFYPVQPVVQGVPVYMQRMQILSMCLSAHRRYPFGSANADVRRKAREIMERAVEFAVAMGIRTIQLAGYDVYYEDSTPDSRKAFAEGLKWAVSLAERYQVMLAMEIMDTPFMNSITKHMAYEKMLNSPWYSVYPDLGNLSAWPENDAEAELSAGAGSIVAVHLKDTLRVSEGFGGKFRGVPFGSGCVDFVKLFSGLESQGYNGPYLMEMWHEEGKSDIVETGRAKAWLEAGFALAVGRS